jgi:hypothetical protein
VPDGVLQVCHPLWRGVRSSALAFGDPVLESSDLSTLIAHLDQIAAEGVSTIVVQGWPPGAAAFTRAAHAAGLSILAVSHSSPAQHGVDGGEAEAFAEMLALQGEGALDGVGVVKAGLRGPFASLGYEIRHVPNRVPDVTGVVPAPQDGGTHAGVFLHPMWRKNVTTQVLAVLTCGWTPHVMADPMVPYLDGRGIVVHGELPASDFLAVMAGMDITLNVTLSECHPMMPMESYRLGVPCLMSRTSDLFREDPELHALTTVDEADDPTAIAEAASHLLEHADRAVELANVALDRIDRESAAAWVRFTRAAP